MGEGTAVANQKLVTLVIVQEQESVSQVSLL